MLSATLRRMLHRRRTRGKAAEALLVMARAARTPTGFARWGRRALTCLLGESVRRRRSIGGYSQRVKPGFDGLHAGAELPQVVLQLDDIRLDRRRCLSPVLLGEWKRPGIVRGRRSGFHRQEAPLSARLYVRYSRIVATYVSVQGRYPLLFLTWRASPTESLYTMCFVRLI